MKKNTTTIAAAAALWLATLVGAYYLGQLKQTNNPATAVPGAAAGGTAGDAGADPGGMAPRRSTGRDAASKPLGMKQILAQIKAAMGAGSMQNPSAMMKVMGLLDKIRPEDVPAALAEADALSDPQQKVLLSMCLLGKWAELDGPAAMKYAEEHASGLGPMGQIAKVSVVSAWAEHDPEAVWQWYNAQPNKDAGGMFGGNMVLSSLFASMAANNPDLAFKRLAEIDGPNRSMALAGMFQSAMFDDTKRQLMLTNVDALPDEAERKQAKQMMLGQWAMMAPEQAVAWVKTQPPNDQRDLRDSMATMLMMSDPKQGASLMLEGVTEEDKPACYSRIMDHWAYMDTNAAGTWLSEQPQGPQLDSARQSFVNAASQKDPQTAMEWATTITSPELKLNATITAYQAWQKKDPAAADQALGKSGLDEAQIQAVRAGQTSPTKDP